MKRIIISVSNDLTTDQRVIKTCDCFNELGYDILLIGRKMKNSLPVTRPYKTFRFQLLFNKGSFFYAEYNLRLFFKLLFLKKDLLLSNDLDTLLPNYLISKIFAVKLIYDSHEFFTEVPELIDRPRVKSFWLFIEKMIFPKLKNVLTVNDKLAEIYTEKYAVPVTVIKNVPFIRHSTASEPTKFRKTNKRIIIYQGAINMGRGLELMIDTMPKLEKYLLVIIGDGDVFQQLKRQVAKLGLEKKVVFLGKILPKDLPAYTESADLGISLEENIGLSYRYSLPNKIFDYIQAGIPVLASDLPLYNQLMQAFKIGEILRNRDPENLASLIDEIYANKASYKESLQKAADLYNWKVEKKVLIEFIKNIE